MSNTTIPTPAMFNDKKPAIVTQAPKQTTISDPKPSTEQSIPSGVNLEQLRREIEERRAAVAAGNPTPVIESRKVTPREYARRVANASPASKPAVSTQTRSQQSKSNQQHKHALPEEEFFKLLEMLKNPEVKVSELTEYMPKIQKVGALMHRLGLKEQYEARQAEAAKRKMQAAKPQAKAPSKPKATKPVSAQLSSLLDKFKQGQTLNVPNLEQLLNSFPEMEEEILPRLEEAKQQRAKRLETQAKKRAAKKERDRDMRAAMRSPKGQKPQRGGKN
jgi:hypothetical protein